METPFFFPTTTNMPLPYAKRGSRSKPGSLPLSVQVTPSQLVKMLPNTSATTKRLLPQTEACR